MVILYKTLTKEHLYNNLYLLCYAPIVVLISIYLISVCRFQNNPIDMKDCQIQTTMQVILKIIFRNTFEFCNDHNLDQWDVKLVTTILNEQDLCRSLYGSLRYSAQYFFQYKIASTTVSIAITIYFSSLNTCLSYARYFLFSHS